MADRTWRAAGLVGSRDRSQVGSSSAPTRADSPSGWPVAAVKFAEASRVCKAELAAVLPFAAPEACPCTSGHFADNTAVAHFAADILGTAGPSRAAQKWEPVKILNTK